MNDEREYICGYCLTAVTTTDGYPKMCNACRMGSCRACNTRLKDDTKWCFGCGKIGPEIIGRFVASDSTASVYMADDWARRSLPHGQSHRFQITSGIDGVSLRRCDTDNYGGDLVRALTDEERTFLGYRTEAEIAALKERDVSGQP